MNLTITVFPNTSARTSEQHTTDWTGFCHWLQHIPEYPSKSACPLIKLASFGDQRTPNGSLRHNDNVLAVTGIEADYDGELINPHHAFQCLQAAGVAAIVVTTSSHTPAAPRWRVFCPLSKPVSPSDRHELVSRLNAILQGCLSPESWTLSQAFYVGRVTGCEYELHQVEGKPIDHIAVRGVGPPQHSRTDRTEQVLRNATGDIARVRKLVESIPNTEPDYHFWAEQLGPAIYGATMGSAEGLEIWKEWSAKCPIEDHRNTCEERWNHWKRSPFDNKGMGALVEYAKERGTHKYPPPLDNKQNCIQMAAYLLSSMYDIYYDEFENNIFVDGEPFTDDMLSSTRLTLEINYQTRISENNILAAFNVIANENKRNPLLDYLGRLVWDGESRLDHLGSRAFGTVDTYYTKEIFAKWMISAVARAFDPGCKADQMLILQGEGGIGKSTALRILAGDAWFSDTLPDVSINTKDAMEHLPGNWIIEVAEFEAFRCAEMSKLKQFVSSQEDKYRPAYGRRQKQHQRRCVFAGSVNEETFLKEDAGGHRRFLAVRTTQIDLEYLKANREQLWAEAVARYRNKEPWYVPHQLVNEAVAEHITRTPEYEAIIESYDPEAPKVRRLSARDVCNELDIDKKHSRRVGRYLVELFGKGRLLNGISRYALPAKR